MWLSNHTALTPGAHLWVLSAPSAWATKLDWALNFQISRIQTHKLRTLTPEQIQNLQEWDLPLFQVQKKLKTPLLVSSAAFLPNQQTVICPLKFHTATLSDITEWLLSAKSIWEQLNRPSLRLFLPDIINKDSGIVSLDDAPTMNLSSHRNVMKTHQKKPSSHRDVMKTRQKYADPRKMTLPLKDWPELEKEIGLVASPPKRSS